MKNDIEHLISLNDLENDWIIQWHTVSVGHWFCHVICQRLHRVTPWIMTFLVNNTGNLSLLHSILMSPKSADSSAHDIGHDYESFRYTADDFPLLDGSMDSLGDSGGLDELLYQLTKDTNISLSGEDIAAMMDEESLSTLRGPLVTVLRCLDVYVLPVVALVGLAGNLLSFVVFVATYMWRLSSSVYLAALCLADMGFLLCVLASWATHIGVDVYHTEGWCQTFIYLTYVSSFLSVWYVVSFTAERYIAVHFPLRRQDLCTTRRAKVAVLVLAFAAALLYSYGLWTSGVHSLNLGYVQHATCGPLPQYTMFVNVAYNVDTVITLLLPFFSILIMNIRIAHRVVLFYRNRKSMAVDTCSSEASGQNCVTARRIMVSAATRTVYTRTQVRVTKMLLTVSTVFLALNLPHHTARTYAFVMSLRDENYQPSSDYIIWNKLFQFLYYLHFSLNIFLYSALGSNFRNALIRLCARIRHGLSEGVCKRLARCRACLRLSRSRHLSTTREIILRDFAEIPKREEIWSQKCAQLIFISKQYRFFKGNFWVLLPCNPRRTLGSPVVAW